MKVWLDAQLPPALAPWLSRRFGIEAIAVRDLQLRDAEDEVIFAAAREAGAVVMTKDSDFTVLVGRKGAPPAVVWLTVGNTSTAALQAILERAWPAAKALLEGGEPLVEIGSLGDAA